MNIFGKNERATFLGITRRQGSRVVVKSSRVCKDIRARVVVKTSRGCKGIRAHVSVKGSLGRPPRFQLLALHGTCQTVS